MCNTREDIQDPNLRTSTQQCIPGFDILDSLIHRIPNLAFAGHRSTCPGVQKPKCLRRPGRWHLGLVHPRNVGTVRDCGRISGYRLEEHVLWGGDGYSSSSKDDVQCMLVNSSTDHDHGPV